MDDSATTIFGLSILYVSLRLNFSPAVLHFYKISEKFDVYYLSAEIAACSYVA